MKKPSVETGQVRQSFSHGRSKPVLVEHKRKRMVEPGHGTPPPRRPLPRRRRHRALSPPWPRPPARLSPAAPRPSAPPRPGRHPSRLWSRRHRRPSPPPLRPRPRRTARHPVPRPACPASSRPARPWCVPRS
ncbi:translation initiation factor IF-2 associated domain-containing protein [Oleomonas cavernae]|nr:translation initiation factor IF-2 associated domain-containing protein [Oleomonas cavernae]